MSKTENRRQFLYKRRQAMKRPEDFMVIPVITIWKLMRTKYFCTIIIFQFCLLNQLASDNNNNNNDKIIIIKKVVLCLLVTL